MALTDKLSNIAVAIREKTGSSASLTLAQMPAAIRSIETGGTSDNKIADYISGNIAVVSAADLSGITRLREYAFYKTNVQSIGMPSTLKTIGTYAFCQSNLQTVAIPSSVTSIESWAFAHCDGLQSVYINEGLTTIPSYCFFDSSNLKTISIPKSVTTIKDHAFVSTQLQNIYYAGTPEEWAAINIDSDNDGYLYGLGGTLESPGMWAPTIHYNS